MGLVLPSQIQVFRVLDGPANIFLYFAAYEFTPLMVSLVKLNLLILMWYNLSFFLTISVWGVLFKMCFCV